MNAFKHYKRVLGVSVFFTLALLASGCVKVNNSDPKPDNPANGEEVLVWSDEFNINGCLMRINGVMIPKEMPPAGVTMKHSIIPAPGWKMLR